jgi:hypothetical protein
MYESWSTSASGQCAGVTLTRMSGLRFRVSTVIFEIDPCTLSVRRFECFTADLYRQPTGCKSCGVQTVTLQSTSVYWISPYDILEERGFEVYLVNARHTKNLPGRKSEVQESQWLLKLHTLGLLNTRSNHPPRFGSCVPTGGSAYNTSECGFGCCSFFF